MRKVVIAQAILFLLFFVTSCSAAPQIYKSNVLTAQHAAIQGTHVAIVPPQGAVSAKGFRGFEAASRGIVLEVVEKMGAPYASSEAGLTEGALAEQGIKLLDTTKVVLNEKPAVLLTCTAAWDVAEGGAPAESPSEDRGLLLFVLGNERLTTFIYGYYNLADRSAANTIRTSLLSAIFQPQQKENTGGGYTLSPAGTSLQFAGEASMTRYYTPGGVPVGETVDGALYSATTLTESVSGAERKTFSQKALGRYLASYDGYEVLSEQQIAYAGLQGFELVAGFEGATRRDRTASGGIVRRSMPGRGYQAVLFDDAGRVFIFQGIAVRDAESHLAEFRRITSTFTLQK